MNKEKIIDNFNCRIRDLEVRSCDRLLLDRRPHTTAEIVKWDGDHCWTVARWIKEDDGFSLKFVGDRPFDTEWSTFMELSRFGHYKLEEVLDDE